MDKLDILAAQFKMNQDSESEENEQPIELDDINVKFFKSSDLEITKKLKSIEEETYAQKFQRIQEEKEKSAERRLDSKEAASQRQSLFPKSNVSDQTKKKIPIKGNPSIFGQRQKANKEEENNQTRSEDNLILNSFLNQVKYTQEVNEKLENYKQKRQNDRDDFLASKQQSVQLQRVEIRSNVTGEVIQQQKVNNWMTNLPSQKQSIITPTQSTKHAEATQALQKTKANYASTSNDNQIQSQQIFITKNLPLWKKKTPPQELNSSWMASQNNVGQATNSASCVTLSNFVQNQNRKTSINSGNQPQTLCITNGRLQSTNNLLLESNSKFFKLNSQCSNVNGSNLGGFHGEFNPANSALMNTKMRRKTKGNSNQEQQTAQPMIFDWFTSLKPEERVLVLTTIDVQICDQIRSMVEKSRQSLSPAVSTSPFVNLAFKKSSLPKSAQEWQFTVTQSTQTKNKNTLVTPTTFIDLSHDSNNRPGRNDDQTIKMYLPSNRHQHQITTFTSYERMYISQTKLFAEHEFLSSVRFTETFEIFDTLTVCPSLVQDAAKFFELAQQITMKTFLMIPLEFELDKGTFTNSYPVWFDNQKEYSLAQWILLFLERSLWIQFEAHVKQSVVAVIERPGFKKESYDFSNQKENLLNAKDTDKIPVFTSTENRLIYFKQQILPFWSDFCKNPQKQDQVGKIYDPKLKELFDELKEKSKDQILDSMQINVDPQDSRVNWLTGGINSTNKTAEKILQKQAVSKRLEDNLRMFKMRFEQMDNQETFEEKLTFIDKLGFANLSTMHDDLLFKIEKLLVETLLAKQKQFALDSMGLSTQNKKNVKKKLKKKLKKLQEDAQKEILQKVDDERARQEEERQQKLLKQAEEEKQVGRLKQEKLRKEKLEREVIFNKKRLAMLGLDQDDSMAALHKKPFDVATEQDSIIETINYPGRKIDEKNTSILQQSVNKNFVSL